MDLRGGFAANLTFSHSKSPKLDTKGSCGEDYLGLKIPKKVKFLLWSQFYRSLNTAKKLQRKFPHWTISISCLCKENKETFDRIFIHCSFERKGWVFVQQEFGMDGYVPSREGGAPYSKSFGRPLMKGKVIFCGIVQWWLIWRERNSRIF